MTNTQNNDEPKLSRPNPFIRWKVVPFIFLFAGLAVVYFFLFFDRHLKSWIEHAASERNGAAVTIGHLSTNLFRGEVQIDDIQAANSGKPKQNVVAVDKITAKFLLEPLLRRKLIFSDLTVQGISIGTPRNTFGDLPPGSEAPPGVQALVHRITPNAFANLNRQVNDNPLRKLGDLSSGLDLSLRAYQLRPKFESLKKLDEVKLALVEKFANLTDQTTLLSPEINLETLNESLRSPASSLSHEELVRLRLRLQHTKKVIQDRRNEIESELQDTTVKLAGLPKLVDKDAARVHFLLGIPRLETPDLTLPLFGTKLLNYLSHLTYWVDMSRRRMPLGVRTLWESFERGMSVHFGKTSAYPAVYLPKLAVTSSTENKPYRGQVEATVTDITSHPKMVGRPVKGTVVADFPSSDFHGLRGQFEIDHTGDLFSERIAANIANFAVHDWKFLESGPLTLWIKEAKAAIQMQAAFLDNKMDISWKVAFRNVEYNIKASDHKLRSILQSTLPPITQFDWTGRVHGPFENVELQSSSQLGQRLSAALREGFRYEMEALDESIRSTISEQVEPKRSELLADLREKRLRFLDGAQELEERLNNAIQLLEKAERRAAEKG